jgi:hypothetical protein
MNGFRHPEQRPSKSLAPILAQLGIDSVRASRPQLDCFVLPHCAGDRLFDRQPFHA